MPLPPSLKRRRLFQHTAARRRLVPLSDRRPWRACFNTQPPEGGWHASQLSRHDARSFNTQPPEGGWTLFFQGLPRTSAFQHTAARRRLGKPKATQMMDRVVSTHSRPKAAGSNPVSMSSPISSFNTQPPEGGWGDVAMTAVLPMRSFNTQPPEGGWFQTAREKQPMYEFQHTAARRRLAGAALVKVNQDIVSTHSRPKAAGCCITMTGVKLLRFQHTAARRRLGFSLPLISLCQLVSTHSRPKAAGFTVTQPLTKIVSFNTQPPEGGWKG